MHVSVFAELLSIFYLHLINLIYLYLLKDIFSFEPLVLLREKNNL